MYSRKVRFCCFLLFFSLDLHSEQKLVSEKLLFTACLGRKRRQRFWLSNFGFQFAKIVYLFVGFWDCHSLIWWENLFFVFFRVSLAGVTTWSPYCVASEYKHCTKLILQYQIILGFCLSGLCNFRESSFSELGGRHTEQVLVSFHSYEMTSCSSLQSILFLSSCSSNCQWKFLFINCVNQCFFLQMKREAESASLIGWQTPP